MFTHLLVIAGQHINAISTWLQKLPLGRRVLTAGILIAFGSELGWPAVATRAIMGALIAMGLTFFGVTLSPLIILTIIALVTLFFDPRLLKHLGIQLSIETLASILAVVPFTLTKKGIPTIPEHLRRPKQPGFITRTYRRITDPAKKRIDKALEPLTSRLSRIDKWVKEWTGTPTVQRPYRKRPLEQLDFDPKQIAKGIDKRFDPELDELEPLAKSKYRFRPTTDDKLHDPIKDPIKEGTKRTYTQFKEWVRPTPEPQQPIAQPSKYDIAVQRALRKKPDLSEQAQRDLVKKMIAQDRAEIDRLRFQMNYYDQKNIPRIQRELEERQRRIDIALREREEAKAEYLRLLDTIKASTPYPKHKAIVDRIARKHPELTDKGRADLIKRLRLEDYKKADVKEFLSKYHRREHLPRIRDEIIEREAEIKYQTERRFAALKEYKRELRSIYTLNPKSPYETPEQYKQKIYSIGNETWQWEDYIREARKLKFLIRQQNKAWQHGYTIKKHPRLEEHALEIEAKTLYEEIAFQQKEHSKIAFSLSKESQEWQAFGEKARQFKFLIKQQRKGKHHLSAIQHQQREIDHPLAIKYRTELSPERLRQEADQLESLVNIQARIHRRFTAEWREGDYPVERQIQKIKEAKTPEDQRIEIAYLRKGIETRQHLDDEFEITPAIPVGDKEAYFVARWQPVSQKLPTRWERTKESTREFMDAIFQTKYVGFFTRNIWNTTLISTAAIVGSGGITISHFRQFPIREGILFAPVMGAGMTLNLITTSMAALISYFTTILADEKTKIHLAEKYGFTAAEMTLRLWKEVLRYMHSSIELRDLRRKVREIQRDRDIRGVDLRFPPEFAPQFLPRPEERFLPDLPEQPLEWLKPTQDVQMVTEEMFVTKEGEIIPLPHVWTTPIVEVDPTSVEQEPTADFANRIDPNYTEKEYKFMKWFRGQMKAVEVYYEKKYRIKNDSTHDMFIYNRPKYSDVFETHSGDF